MNRTEETLVMKIIYYDYIPHIQAAIGFCEEEKHLQQVAYSSYHSALTQVCFTCKKIRTNIDKMYIEGWKT